MLPEVWSSSALSVLEDRSEPQERISIMTAIGIRCGMSMFLIFCQRVAPSMVAASYSCGSMEVSVAI